jgi:hypothetical protein
MSLGVVTQFMASASIVRDTERALRNAGEDGYELFVLWTGRIDATAFLVDHIYVPTQQSLKLDDGLCVRVGADELHRLNVWLYTENQVLGVQIHSHPRRAYHSDTDDTYPIVTTLGGVSIVVPNFCGGGMTDPGTAVYRLTGEGWLKLGRRDALALVPSLHLS